MDTTATIVSDRDGAVDRKLPSCMGEFGGHS